MTNLLFSSMRNEGPAVLEWIAYHLSIGFDQIMIATNNCDDGSDDLIRALGQIAPVTHIDNGDHGEDSPQRRAYERMMETPEFKAAEYLMILDADEFLNIHDGSGKLSDLITAMGDHDVMGVNWACFGPSGEMQWRDAWVTERFTERLVPKWGLYAVGSCKALTRAPQRFRRFFNHSPGPKIDRSDISYLRDYGEVETIASDGAAKRHMRMNYAYKVEYRHAQINHYVTKSMPEFRLRIARGRGHVARRENDRHTFEYFKQYVDEHEMVQDTSIARHLDAVKQKACELLENSLVLKAYTNCQKTFEQRVKQATRDWDETRYEI